VPNAVKIYNFIFHLKDSKQSLYYLLYVVINTYIIFGNAFNQHLIDIDNFVIQFEESYNNYYVTLIIAMVSCYCTVPKYFGSFAVFFVKKRK
jgi:hypothetical protein